MSATVITQTRTRAALSHRKRPVPRRTGGPRRGRQTSLLESEPGFEEASEERKLARRFEVVKGTYARHPLHSLVKWHGRFTHYETRWAIESFLGGRSGSTVLDPFCGSGTVLLEAVLAGHWAYGLDCDPLARLVAKVKTTPLPPNLRESDFRPIRLFLDNLEVPESLTSELAQFQNRDHWFTPSAQSGLARILYSIRAVDDPDFRDMLMVSLANVVRPVSTADPKQIFPERTAHFEAKRPHVSEGHVIRLFRQEVWRVVGLLTRFVPQARASVIGDDARHIPLPDGSERSGVGLVDTNPPYIGAIDYVRAFRLERYVLQLVERDSDIRRKWIGQDRTDPSAFYADMGRVVGEIARVLQPGGYCVLRTANVRVHDVSLDVVDRFKTLFADVGMDHIVKVTDRISDERRTLFFVNRKHNGYIAEDYQLVFRKPGWSGSKSGLTTPTATRRIG